MSKDGGDRTDGHRTVAVALSGNSKSHDGKSGGGPRVVATGHGAVAEQILEIAFAAGVKVRQDADLAQLLAAVDVDSLIPFEAFSTVAEILTYVYRANGQFAETKPEPGP